MQLPFTEQQFFEVIRNYNQTVWPAQIVLTAVGGFMAAFALWRPVWSTRALWLALASLWCWTGLIYHFAFFTTVNPAAYVFGALFLLGAAAFLWFAFARGDVVFRIASDYPSYIGLVLVGYSLIIYPMWSSMSGHSYPELPTFGLPCPTTIFTIGLLAFVRGCGIWPLFVAPILWSSIGLQAAFLFGVQPDLGLGVAGMAAIAFVIRSLRHSERTT